MTSCVLYSCVSLFQRSLSIELNSVKDRLQLHTHTQHTFILLRLFIKTVASHKWLRTNLSISLLFYSQETEIKNIYHSCPQSKPSRWQMCLCDGSPFVCLHIGNACTKGVRLQSPRQVLHIANFDLPVDVIGLYYWFQINCSFFPQQILKCFRLIARSKYIKYSFKS